MIVQVNVENKVSRIHWIYFILSVGYISNWGMDIWIVLNWVELWEKYLNIYFPFAYFSQRKKKFPTKDARYRGTWCLFISKKSLTHSRFELSWFKSQGGRRCWKSSYSHFSLFIINSYAHLWMKCLQTLALL